MIDNNKQEDPITFTKETVKIGEGRNLYRYTFAIETEETGGTAKHSVPQSKGKRKCPGPDDRRK